MLNCDKSGMEPDPTDEASPPVSASSSLNKPKPLKKLAELGPFADDGGVKLCCWNPYEFCPRLYICEFHTA